MQMQAETRRAVSLARDAAIKRTVAWKFRSREWRARVDGAKAELSRTTDVLVFWQGVIVFSSCSGNCFFTKCA